MILPKCEILYSIMNSSKLAITECCICFSKLNNKELNKMVVFCCNCNSRAENAYLKSELISQTYCTKGIDFNK